MLITYKWNSPERILIHNFWINFASVKNIFFLNLTGCVKLSFTGREFNRKVQNVFVQFWDFGQLDKNTTIRVSCKYAFIIEKA